MPSRHRHYIEEIRNLLDRLQNVVADSLTIGTSPDEVTLSSPDGLKYNGESTVWEDIQSSLIGSKLDSNAGSVDYNLDENTITFQRNGDIDDTADRVMWNYQLPHSAKLDGSLHLHVHWEQTDTTARTFTMEYRVQSNGQTKETAWTQVSVDGGTGVNDAFTYTSGTLNQITPIVNLDTTGWGISAVAQFRMTRSDSNSGDIDVTYVDAHYERDTLGSREEYVK